MKSELLNLMNVGKATLADFELLGINSIAQLAECSADELYIDLQLKTGCKHDPCVWDVFAATIYEAKTGEKQKWWEWTKIRKQREYRGKFIGFSDISGEKFRSLR